MGEVAGIAQMVEETLAGVLPPALAGADPLVRLSDRADFQSSVALAARPAGGTSPRELAASIAARLPGRGGVRTGLPQPDRAGRADLEPDRAAGGRSPARGGYPAGRRPHRHRLLRPQRGQGDARGAPALDGHR